MAKIRIIGFALIAIAAIVVLAITSSGTGTPSGLGSGPAVQTDVSGALSSWQANENVASSAPQQSVVGGWAAKDLLGAIGRAQAAELDNAVLLSDSSSKSNDRIAILALIAVIALCWHGATLPWIRATQARRATVDSNQPGSE